MGHHFRPERAERILARSGGCCAWCGAPLRGRARKWGWQVDHLLPVSAHGYQQSILRGDDALVVASCRECNQQRGDMEPEEWALVCAGVAEHPRPCGVCAGPTPCYACGW